MSGLHLSQRYKDWQFIQGEEHKEQDDDLISRDELLKAIDTWDKFGYTETGCFVREPKGDYVPYIHYDDVIKCIKGMPSANPQEPKTGHWILARTFPTRLYDEYLNEYECSECYRRIRCTESQLVNYPYCHCGCRMFEPQESEDKDRSRDSRLLQEIRQEITKIPIPYDDKDTLEHQYGEGLIRDAIIEIIDKHIKEIEGSDTE